MGRSPTAAELADTLSMPEGRVRKILRVPEEPVSLDMADGDGSFPADDIEDGAAVNAEEVVIQASLRAAMRDALNGSLCAAAHNGPYAECVVMRSGWAGGLVFRLQWPK